MLFEPELGIGARINDRLTIEASLGPLEPRPFLGGQNPGIDNIGARLNLGKLKAKGGRPTARALLPA